MPFEARFLRGDTHVIKFTAGAAYDAGEVIDFGGCAAVVHPTAVANGAEGSLAIHGGEWELVKDGTTGPDIELGESVAWIVSTNLASDVTTGNLPFGPCTVPGGASSATVVAFLDPARVAANDDT